MQPLKTTGWGILVSTPLAGLLVLIAVPQLDVRWEHQPAHFWLVLGAAAITGVLAYATGDAARRRGDARIFLVSLAFLCSAGFLLLHALATPGVLLEGSNPGFAIATPVGLTLAAALFAASALPLGTGDAAAVMKAMSVVRAVLLVVLAVWAFVSLAELPPFDGPPPLGRGSLPLVLLASVAIAGYAVSALLYLRLYLRRPSRLVASVIAGCVLLAQAMVAVAFSRNWHMSWWEWHALMLVAFAVVAWSARTQWREEPFSDLYLSETVAGRREVSVIFADLQGYTSFSEAHEPEEVTEMLNAFFDVAIPPVVQEQGGEVNQIVGDAIMVIFNARGDQPDHAERSVRAALGLRDAAAALARQHPDWPRLRIGVNTGEVIVGLVGAAGGRKYTAIGDAVNVAARLESSAPPGGVVTGSETIRQVRGVRFEALGTLKVKGKDQPLEAYLVQDMSDAGP